MSSDTRFLGKSFCVTKVIGRYDSPRYDRWMGSQVGILQSVRVRAMVIPREHGAWGMLLVPMVTGAIVGSVSPTRNYVAFTVFAFAALALFWLRTPVEAWLGTTPVKAQGGSERQTVAIFTVVLSAAALLGLGWLFLAGYFRGLLVIGAGAAAAFAAQALVRALGRARRMLAQIVGSVGLTATAAAAYYVTTGRLDRTALGLWLANGLFAGNKVHYVRLCIRGSRAARAQEKLQLGMSFLAGQVLLLLGILIGIRLGDVPALVLFAFAPALLRGVLWFHGGRKPLQVHQLGFSELRQSLLFGALLCLAVLS